MPSASICLSATRRTTPTTSRRPKLPRGTSAGERESETRSFYQLIGGEMKGIRDISAATGGWWALSATCVAHRSRNVTKGAFLACSAANKEGAKWRGPGRYLRLKRPETPVKEGRPVHADGLRQGSSWRAVARRARGRVRWRAQGRRQGQGQGQRGQGTQAAKQQVEERGALGQRQGHTQGQGHLRGRVLPRPRSACAAWVARSATVSSSRSAAGARGGARMGIASAAIARAAAADVAADAPAADVQHGTMARAGASAAAASAVAAHAQERPQRQQQQLQQFPPPTASAWLPQSSARQWKFAGDEF
uniref:Uncharacterized protein n=1 Tax=Alexandrium monilatum TaxID=311494 RepID=A0A7S4RQD1_9DINO